MKPNNVDKILEELGFEKQTIFSPPKMVDRATCSQSGKQKYPSEAEALKAARNRENKGAHKLRVYLCNQCDCWHMAKAYTAWNVNNNLRKTYIKRKEEKVV
jgi:NAD-dependent SIR2 family protein deacetylase